MAGYSINRIPESQKILIPSVPSLWSTNGPTLSSSPIEKYEKEGSLQALLSEGDSISYNTYTGLVNGLSTLTSTNPDDVGDSVSAFVWVKSDTPIVVKFSVYILYPFGVPASSSVASESKSISVTSGEWTLLRLYDLPIVPDDAYTYPIGFRILIEDIQGGGTAIVNVSHPVIYGTLDFIDNPGLIQLASSLPEFIRDQDANAEPLPFQLARFLEAVSIHNGEIAELINNFIYQDISEGKNDADAGTLSALVNPLIAPREYLFWLAQFSGTRIVNPKTGFTPWANLPDTWQEIDLIDSEESTEDAAPWRAIQEYNTEPAGLEEFLRWQVSNGFYGYRSGTKEALLKSVERVLLGNKTTQYEIVEPFNWTIKIKTLKSETPDAALLPVGSSVPEILELIEPARPLGFLVIHELM